VELVQRSPTHKQTANQSCPLFSSGHCQWPCEERQALVEDADLIRLVMPGEGRLEETKEKVHEGKHTAPHHTHQRKPEKYRCVEADYEHDEKVNQHEKGDHGAKSPAQERDQAECESFVGNHPVFLVNGNQPVKGNQRRTEVLLRRDRIGRIPKEAPFFSSLPVPVPVPLLSSTVPVACHYVL